MASPRPKARSRPRPPAANARFRTRRHPSGVDFYAADLLERIDVDEIRPGRVGSLPILSELWEQVVLPLRAWGRPLISPCNSGPLVKRRQLLIVHDVAPIVGPQWFSPLYRRKAALMTRYLFPRVRVAATVSRSSAADLAEVTGRVDILVLPNVPARRVPSEPPTRTVADLLAEPFVVSVSNLEPRKNLATLLRAWEQVEASVPTGRLVIVGAGAERVFGDVDLRSASSRVSVLGRVGDSDVGHLYDGCSAVVTVPHYEGFGRVLVEGVLHGAPVIASDIAAHREVVGGPVTFVDPTDVDSIAAAIADALRTPRVDSSASAPPPNYSVDDLERELSRALARLDGPSANADE